MRILLIVHGYPPAAGGGTEMHTRSLAHSLQRRGHEIFILSRRADDREKEYHMFRREEGGLHIIEINNNFSEIRSFEDSYRNRKIAEIAGEILDEIRPDLGHIQHLTCLSTEIPRLMKDRGIPAVFTLNDYWLLCHRGQLFDLDLRRCPGPSAEGCARCIAPHAGLPETAFRAASILSRVERILPKGPALGLRRRAARHLKRAASLEHARSEAERRRNSIEKLIGQVDLFLTPSDTLHEIFLGAGFPRKKLRRVRQGIETGLFSDLLRRPSSRLRLGFLGSLIVSKAPDVLLRAFRMLSEGSAELHIWGSVGGYHGDDSYAETVKALLEGPGIFRHGFVPHEEIGSVFSAIDILVIPSIWIENAPFVIREAFAAGVPVVASDIGGMSEMVEDGVSGLHFRAGDPEDLARKLRRLIQEEGLLTKLRTGIPEMPSITEYSGDLEELFLELLRRPGDRPKLAAVILNYRRPGDTLLAVRSLQSSRRKVDQIIVVDNASGDDSISRLRGISGITLISNEENLGFSGGCNVGIRKALEEGAGLILLLNSDAVLTRETLGLLEEAMENHPGVGIAGPLILHRSHPLRVASAGIDISLSSGRMKHRGFGKRCAEVRGKSHDVVAVSGCAMLISREVFEDVGLFDEGYFFSFEEIAFCLRAGRAGRRSLVAAGARAYHAGALSIGATSPDRSYYACRNHLLALQREAPAPWPLSGLRTGLVLGYNIAHALLRSSGRGQHLRAVIRGFLDYHRGRDGPA